jgi:hypothetical protein
VYDSKQTPPPPPPAPAPRDSELCLPLQLPLVINSSSSLLPPPPRLRGVINTVPPRVRQHVLTPDVQERKNRILSAPKFCPFFFHQRSPCLVVVLACWGAAAGSAHAPPSSGSKKGVVELNLLGQRKVWWSSIFHRSFVGKLRNKILSAPKFCPVFVFGTFSRQSVPSAARAPSIFLDTAASLSAQERLSVVRSRWRPMPRPCTASRSICR